MKPIQQGLADKLVRCLIESIPGNQLSNQNVRDIRHAVYDYLSDRILDIWSVEDVENYCDDHGIEIEDDQKIDVLRGMLARQDASFGLNWSIMQAAIDEQECYKSHD